MRHRIADLSILWLALASAALPLAAQDPDTDEDAAGLFVDTVDVNVVNVEVYVTDRDGKPVRGLTKDDFELEVSRRPVAISNFYAVEEGVASIGGEQLTVQEDPEEPADPRLADPYKARKLPEDQRLHLIVYVDNLNIHPFNRNRVLGAARTFLRSRLRPGDEVMLVTYERTMHVRHPFTQDPELVASLLFDLEEMSGQRIHADSDRRDIMALIYEAKSIYDVRGRATQYAEALHSDMRFTIDALKSLIDTLAGLPGRKAVLHVSDGLPMRAGEDVFHAMHEQFTNEGQGVLMDIQRYDLTRYFQQLTSKANANRVTFYMIEAAGLRTYSYMNASNRVEGGGSQIDQIHFSNLQSPLHMLANETGGLAIINTNNFVKPLDRVANDFGNYYSLGFSPGSAESGRYHDVKVRLRKGKKGWRLRYREGYRDKPVSTRMTESTMAALHYGYQSNALHVQLELGEEMLRDGGQYLVHLRVRIPIGELTFLSQDDMQRGRVRIFVGAKDSEGGIAPVQDLPVPIDIPQAEFEVAREKFYEYEIPLLMREGRQVVAVGVRDEIGAVMGFVTRGLRVGT